MGRTIWSDELLVSELPKHTSWEQLSLALGIKQANSKSTKAIKSAVTRLGLDSTNITSERIVKELVPLTSKMCTKCLINKDIVNFSARGTRYQSWCKSCCAGTNKMWYTENYSSIKPRKRINGRKYRYDLTEKQYKDMLDQQGGKCACCGIVEPVHIDHDHSCCPGAKTCGRCVRGLLCQKCNTFIGWVETNPDLYDKAKRYIDK